MTVSEYLYDVFIGNGAEGNFNFYKVAVQGKGEVIAEHNTEDDTVNLIHTDRSGRQFNYETNNVKELRETVEYCLGPIVTDNQWRRATGNEELIIDDGEDWENIH